MTRLARSPLAICVFVTLLGCPSDPPGEADADDGTTTGMSTGVAATADDDTTSAGTTSVADGTTDGTRDSDGATETTGSTGTDTADTTSSTGSIGTSDGSSGTDSSTTDTSGSTDASSTSAATDGTTTDTGSTGDTDSSSGTSTGAGSSSSTGGDEPGFGQCDSPDDCLPGEGCLNDNLKNPTVSVCFLEGCVNDEDCPALPPGGDSSAFCVDVTGDGTDDCVIVCSSTECPTGMECFSNSICVWPLG